MRERHYDGDDDDDEGRLSSEKEKDPRIGWKYIKTI